jgi:hypothetical protein
MQFEDYEHILGSEVESARDRNVQALKCRKYMLHFVPITLKHRNEAMVLNFRPETAFSTPECAYRMFDPCPCCVDVTYWVAGNAPIP